MPRLSKILVALVVVAALVGAVWLRIDETANEIVGEANVAIHAATLAGRLFQAQARNVDPLLNEATFRADRATLTTAAREASQLAGEAERAFRHAADTAHRAIDLTRQEEVRAVWERKRDSLRHRAEAAAAAKLGYAVAADESLADLATMRTRMEPFARRAEESKAAADRLNADANKPTAENPAEF